jgi:hypothetical protein
MKNVYVVRVLQNMDLVAFELLFAVDKRNSRVLLACKTTPQASICLYQIALYVQLAKYSISPMRAMLVVHIWP